MRFVAGMVGGLESGGLTTACCDPVCLFWFWLSNLGIMAGGVLACVIVLGRLIVIVDRDCYPCLPSTLVYFDVPNDRHEKAAMIGGLCLTCGLVL